MRAGAALSTTLQTMALLVRHGDARASLVRNMHIVGIDVLCETAHYTVLRRAVGSCCVLAIAVCNDFVSRSSCGQAGAHVMVITFPQRSPSQ